MSARRLAPVGGALPGSHYDDDDEGGTKIPWKNGPGNCRIAELEQRFRTKSISEVWS